MLMRLAVRNLVLIERLVLELSPGFNVLTGETGAGKSMLIDALALVLGGRARPDMVRTGTKEAEVEALFEISPGSRTAARLEAAGVPCERDLVVRRIVQAEGRSRAFVNDRLVTAGQLAALMPDLCDIASQHESVTLTDPSTHLEYLDAFGKLGNARDALAAKVEEVAAVARALEQAKTAERGRAEREDFLRFQLGEIDELGPTAGEEVALEQERARLRHAEKLGSVTRRATERLYDAEGAICDELARMAADLEGAAAIDPTLAEFARGIDAARAELADRARGLARYAEAVESNPARLGEVEERSFRLQKLLRKHGPTTTELIEHRDALAVELETLAAAEERIGELQATRDATLAIVAAEAKRLSTERRKVAEGLATAIGRELSHLGMGRARVVVDVAPTPSGATDALVIEGARLTANGIDRVEFLIAPNKGEDPRPLRKIASGGELSRALLALKRVLAGDGPASLYVFDEVDAGVGGAVAEVIGKAIADIAQHRQVLCITHLPQIAAQGAAHFVIDKREADGRTVSRVTRLGEEERVDEIARMLGGVKVGEATRQAAIELIASSPKRPAVAATKSRTAAASPGGPKPPASGPQLRQERASGYSSRSTRTKPSSQGNASTAAR
jgi:DNA repair protein RecN (Recombination protein N)